MPGTVLTSGGSHPAPESRSLLVTDFVFHILKVEGLWNRFGWWLNGGIGEPIQSRTLRSTFRDKGALRESTEALLDLDFDRLILCHGEVIDSGGKDALRQAAARLLH